MFRVRVARVSTLYGKRRNSKQRWDYARDRHLSLFSSVIVIDVLTHHIVTEGICDLLYADDRYDGKN